MLAQGARHGHATALMFLDLDEFKRVNDRFGHEMGDKLLNEVGRRLVRCVRCEDTVSRFAGDEFVIVLPEVAKRQDVETTAQKIITLLNQPLTLAGHSLEITASIGIAIATPDAQLNSSGLLAQADEAMYQAKQAGRNRYRFA